MASPSKQEHSTTLVPEAQVVAALATAAAHAEPRDLYGHPVVIGRDTFGRILVEDVSRLLPKPARRTTTTEVVTAQSLIREVERLRGTREITLQAALDRDTLTVRLDPETADQTSWDRWSVSLRLRHSREWKVWEEANGKTMAQATFAEFLEDNLPDVVEPTGAEMMLIIKDLQAKTGVTFNSAVTLENGDRQLLYEEKTEAKGKGGVAIPSEFNVALRPYEGCDPFRVRCLLRYRLDGGKLLLAYKLHRPEAILETVFGEHVEQVEEALGLKAIRIP